MRGGTQSDLRRGRSNGGAAAAGCGGCPANDPSPPPLAGGQNTCDCTCISHMMPLLELTLAKLMHFRTYSLGCTQFVQLVLQPFHLATNIAQLCFTYLGLAGVDRHFFFNQSFICVDSLPYPYAERTACPVLFAAAPLNDHMPRFHAAHKRALLDKAVRGVLCRQHARLALPSEPTIPVPRDEVIHPVPDRGRHRNECV